MPLREGVVVTSSAIDQRGRRARSGMQFPCMVRCVPTRHSCVGVAASSPAGKASTRTDRLNSIMRSTRLLASVEHFIMDGMLVEAGKHGPGGRGDVAGGVILAHEGADAVQAVEIGRAHV